MPTVAELKVLAKKKGIQGYSTMKKAELEKALGVSPSKKTTLTKKTAKSKTGTKTKKPFGWIVLAYVKGQKEPEIDVFAKREDAILYVLSKAYESEKSNEENAATLVKMDDYVVSGKWSYLVEPVSGLPGGKVTNLKLIKIVKEALAKA